MIMLSMLIDRYGQNGIQCHFMPSTHNILNCSEDSLSYVLYAEVIAVSGCNNFCAMLMGL